jgi:hypothetical protein
MLGPTALSPQSRKVGLETELQIKSVPRSIYTALKGLYNAKQQNMPSGIYMKVNEVALRNAWRARITLLERLSGAGVMGGRQAIGEEEQPSTKVAEVYHNNCRKVVSVPGYGIEKLHAEYLNLFEKFIDQLADWNREQEDLEIHQALLETYGETLLHGETSSIVDPYDPTAGSGPCAPRWNPNVFVAGLGAHNQPDYDLSVNTHTQNILTSLGQTPGGNGTFLDTDALSNLSNYALLKRIEPLDIPGAPSGKGYVLTISELQAMYIGDPNWSVKNLGSLFVQKTGLNDKIMNWPGVIGMYKDLLLVVDHRTPTVTRTGSTALNAGYIKHGNIDERNRDQMSTGDVFDVAILHGRGAVVKWEPEPLHSIKQDDDYQKINGVGTACVRGIQIPLYWRNIENKGSDPPEQFTSAVVLCAMPGEVSP